MSSLQSDSESREITGQALRRRTFAIISHPDAGKTTLTEKFLLYGGAVAEAGAVKSRRSARGATSDWMELEKQRGISVSSTALQFEYRDRVINLLDTPGHRDFSEDTYRVLAAADAAIMVLDVAKGVETQTLKLFEVCRARNLPTLTFINKYDRPGRDPLELLDQIATEIGLEPTPVTWPVGIPGDFRGVIDRRDTSFVEFTRSAHGATVAGERTMSLDQARELHGDLVDQANDGCGLLTAIGADYDRETFLDGQTTPLFVGSALTNFGVRHMLDAVVDLAPSPGPRNDADDNRRGIDRPFSGFVFKVQANMNAAHRDRVAFLRVCSGHFERGMTVTHQPSGRPFATKYASSVFGADRNTIDDAYPGDVVGLVNANEVRIGDTLFVDAPVRFPDIPSFAPELFAEAISLDTSKAKQFRKGLTQLGHEGVVQVLSDRHGEPVPIVAAVGEMQFEVFMHRLRNEFNASPELRRLGYVVACRTDVSTADRLGAYRSTRVVSREDGVLLALFESTYFLDRLRADNPDWRLDPVV